MQVEAVFSDVSAGADIVRVLSDHGMKATLHHEFKRFMECFQAHDGDAFVVEDDGINLEMWLPPIVERLPRSSSLIVFGPGEPKSMALAMHYGAHDYATIGEGGLSVWRRLMARQAFARLRSEYSLIHMGAYALDVGRQQLRLGDQCVSLTARETTLLNILSSRKGRVVSIDSLSFELCRRSAEMAHRAVEQHVYRLRRKIMCLQEAANQRDSLRLVAVYGLGYRLEVT